MMLSTFHPPAQNDAVSPFPVWVRPMGLAWKVRVGGIANSKWLCNEFLQRGLECSELKELPGSGQFVFTCMSRTPHEKDYVWDLLKKLDQTQLQNNPA
jgi:hypothetical protein